MLIPALYIVATPIGNLSDITLRAMEVLKSVDLIAAEDTRHSRILLHHYLINTPLMSLHGDNEVQKADDLLQMIQAGKSIALISDAGTPLVSDPGGHVVQKARAAGLSVIPIPGPCALIAALSVCEFSTKRFHFEGFLPHKGKARTEALTALQYHEATLLFYESRHRILDFLALAIEVFGPDRRAMIARELTKQYETIQTDTLAALSSWIAADHNQQKGEYVVLIEGAALTTSEHIASDQVMKVLARYLSTKEAAKATAEITGRSQRDCYEALLQLKISRTST